MNENTPHTEMSLGIMAPINFISNSSAELFVINCRRGTAFLFN